MGNKSVGDISEVIKDFRDRSSRFYKSSLFTFFLILFSMFGALMIFIFAESITETVLSELLSGRVASSPPLPDKAGENSWEMVVTRITVRAGALFILIFLVRLLITIYRYQVNMATFYASRADALQISLLDESNTLESLFTAFFPSDIEWEKYRQGQLSRR